MSAQSGGLRQKSDKGPKMCFIEKTYVFKISYGYLSSYGGGKHMNRLLMLFCAVVLLGAQHVWAAQSTADVPVNDSLLESARTEILGSEKARLNMEDEYVIGHGDILSVQVYGEGEMAAADPGANSPGRTGEDGPRNAVGVQVRIDGRISLKHIGDISAVGFTPTQLADYLKQIYSTVYDDPIVTVVLVQSNSQRYTVMGKVARPGIFFLDYPINIVQAVARCGGFTEWAKSEITVVRKGEKAASGLFKNNTLTFDYEDFLDGKGLEKNVQLRAGDTVIVH